MVTKKSRRPDDIRRRVTSWCVWVLLGSCAPYLVAVVLRMRHLQTFSPDMLPLIASGQLFITAIGWLIGAMRELNSETCKLPASHRSVITGSAVFSLFVAASFYGVSVSPLGTNYVPTVFDQLLTSVGAGISCLAALILSIWTVVANTPAKAPLGRLESP